MKTTIKGIVIVLITFLFCNQNMEAQCFTSGNAAKIITIQAGKPVEKKSLTVKKDSAVVIRVSGYNPLVYNVRINAKDSAVSIGETPQLISGLSADFFKWFAELKFNLLNPSFHPEKNTDHPDANERGKMVINRIIKNTNDLLNDLFKYMETADQMYHTWYYDKSLTLDTDFYKSFKKRRESIEEDFKEIQKVIAFIDNYEVLSDFQTYYAVLDSLRHKVDIRKLSAIKADYINYRTMDGDYYSLPFFLNDDMKEITVEITPYSKDTKAPSFNTQLMLKRNNILFFGFSSGFFISDVRSHHYSAKPEPGSSTSVYSIVPENVNKNQIGIQAMVHTGWGLSDWSVIQLGVGPTLGFQDKIIPGMALGAGLGLGRKKKLMLNTGYHFSFVQRLSNAYSESGIRFAEVPPFFTVTSIEKGWFLSIGFNFLNF